MNTRDFFKGGRRHSLIGTVLAVALLLTIATPAQSQGGGNVQPPDAKPHGYSLEEMAKLMALFDTSLNNPLYYPKTPFQILAAPFGDPNNPSTSPITCPATPGGTGILVTGSNTFVVKPGTPFFVPLQAFDDSPAVVGIFPANKSQVADYVFGAAGYGARGYHIIVDRDTTPVGPEFLAGPVEQKTPPLLDGGGTHLIQLGVFLTPMSVGTHVVTITGEIASNAVLSAFGIGCVAEYFTYTVKVVPGA